MNLLGVYLSIVMFLHFICVIIHCLENQSSGLVSPYDLSDCHIVKDCW